MGYHHRPLPWRFSPQDPQARLAGSWLAKAKWWLTPWRARA